MRSKLAYVAIAILLIAVIALSYLNFQPRSQNQSVPQSTSTVYVSSVTNSQNQNYTSLQANYSIVTSKLNNLEQNYASLLAKYNASNTNTSQEVVQVLYKDKAVHIDAPVHNYNYSYLNGCYWISGYYNFSFNAPYAGYIVFNQTNTGRPNNNTFSWFSLSISNQKAKYAIISPYNLTGCTGESFWDYIAPWNYAGPFNNQTMIIPITNGTNYVILYNNNADNQFGLDNPINLTFSMKYVGFKPYVINNPFPPYNSFASQTGSTIPSLNTQLTPLSKVFVGYNISNTSIGGFNVKLVSLGSPSAEGLSPAVVNIYFNNTLHTNQAIIYPGQSLPINVSGHTINVYVNQTSQEYSYGSKWATIQLFS